MANERLQGEGRRHTNWQSWVRHAVQDIAVNREQMILVLEVQLLELLDGVTSPSPQVALGAGEVRKYVSYEEVLDLISNGGLLAQHYRSECADHA